MSYAQVNGLNLYYESHGSGRPLVLLHGGLGSTEMFEPDIETLVAGGHQVIAPDFQGHGRTADIDRPIDVKLLATDIVTLIEQLGLEQPDLVGYSLGGGTAFFTALARPDLVRRLVLISTAMRDSAYYPEIRAQQDQMTLEAAEMIKGTPMGQVYARTAPRPEDWSRLILKIGQSMAAGFDYSAELDKLQTPTLLVFADGDISPPSHAVEIYERLGGGQRDGGWDKAGLPVHQLAIMPGQTHYTVYRAPTLAPLINEFLGVE